MEDAQTVGWIAAIIIGGIAGWLAEMFMKSNMGVFMNIILGIIGAALAMFGTRAPIGPTAQPGRVAAR